MANHLPIFLDCTLPTGFGQWVDSVAVRGGEVR